MSDKLISLAESHLPAIPLKAISQGAEAIIFTTNTHPYLPTTAETQDKQYIVKFRPPKHYRHPTLDSTLTKHRTIAEARLLQKLTNISEVSAPSLIALDSKNGILWMECVGFELPNNAGVSSLKNWLWQYNHDDVNAVTEDVQALLKRVGLMIGELHKNDLIHGDLTSSNIIITEDCKPTLIDFGLSFQSNMVEDKAVDLYVLERAMLSTHPLYADHYNAWLMAGYESAFKVKGDRAKLKEIIKRYEDVRMRGRKRSMLG